MRCAIAIICSKQAYSIDRRAPETYTAPRCDRSKLEGARTLEPFVPDCELALSGMNGAPCALVPCARGGLKQSFIDILLTFKRLLSMFRAQDQSVSRRHATISVGALDPTSHLGTLPPITITGALVAARAVGTPWRSGCRRIARKHCLGARSPCMPVAPSRLLLRSHPRTDLSWPLHALVPASSCFISNSSSDSLDLGADTRVSLAVTLCALIH